MVWNHLGDQCDHGAERPVNAGITEEIQNGALSLGIRDHMSVHCYQLSHFSLDTTYTVRCRKATALQAAILVSGTLGLRTTRQSLGSNGELSPLVTCHVNVDVKCYLCDFHLLSEFATSSQDDSNVKYL